MASIQLYIRETRTEMFCLTQFIDFPMRRYICFLGLICLAFSSTMAQEENLYDEAHSLAFAQHLYENKQYQYAAIEYERVLFYSPDNQTVQLRLTNAYLRSQQFSKGIQRTEQWYQHPRLIPAPLAFPYGKLLLLDQRYTPLQRLWEQSPVLQPEERSYLQLSHSLLTADWESAKQLYGQDGEQHRSLEPFAFSMSQVSLLKRKNPWVALGLSVVIPGMGRVYSKQWKDGLLSLILIGSLSYFSYRNFSRNGRESVLGWVYGGLAIGFYGGNLYGSFQSANRYHDRQTQRIQADVQRVLRTNL